MITVAGSGGSTNWCGFIDGVQKDCGSSANVGFTTAKRTIYSGETTDTLIQLGGTAGLHYRLYNLRFRNTTNTWYQVNTDNLQSVTQAGTPYRASKGFASPNTYVDNWTE